MEFKYNDCAPGTTPEAKQRIFGNMLESGLSQIKEKGYSRKYEGSSKKVYHAAFAFLGRDDIEMRSELQ